MNITDLRLAFKMDTGDDPLWAKNHDGHGIQGTSWQKGYPRTIYGLWIEDKIGKPKYLRDRYYQVTHEAPAKFYFGAWKYMFSYGGAGREVLFGEYIEWLETFVLKFKPEIVSNLIKVD